MTTQLQLNITIIIIRCEIFGVLRICLRPVLFMYRVFDISEQHIVGNITNFSRYTTERAHDTPYDGAAHPAAVYCLQHCTTDTNQFTGPMDQSA